MKAVYQGAMLVSIGKIFLPNKPLLIPTLYKTAPFYTIWTEIVVDIYSYWSNVTYI